MLPGSFIQFGVYLDRVKMPTVFFAVAEIGTLISFQNKIFVRVDNINLHARPTLQETAI